MQCFWKKLPLCGWACHTEVPNFLRYPASIRSNENLTFKKLLVTIVSIAIDMAAATFGTEE